MGGKSAAIWSLMCARLSMSATSLCSLSVGDMLSVSIVERISERVCAIKLIAFSCSCSCSLVMMLNISFFEGEICPLTGIIGRFYGAVWSSSQIIHL